MLSSSQANSQLSDLGIIHRPRVNILRRLNQLPSMWQPFCTVFSLLDPLSASEYLLALHDEWWPVMVYSQWLWAQTNLGSPDIHPFLSVW